MAERRLGIIMNGVTGRMGMNQHLIRSILAIRAAGRRHAQERRPRHARPDPGRPQRRQGRGAGQAPRRPALDDRPRRGARRSEGHGLLRRRDDPGARRAAQERHGRRQARLLREAGRRDAGRGAWSLSRLARKAGVKHGVVQDKLFLPGLQKLKMLRDSGFFGRILVGARRIRLLGVRGRLAAGAAAELELPQGRRRRHHPRHALPLALCARQSVRRGEERELPRCHAHPEALGRERQALHRRRRRCGLCDLPCSTAASSRTSTARGRRACGATTW